MPLVYGSNVTYIVNFEIIAVGKTSFEIALDMPTILCTIGRSHCKNHCLKWLLPDGVDTI